VENQLWTSVPKIKGLNPVKVFGYVKSALWDHKAIASKAEIPSIFLASVQATDLSLCSMCDRKDKQSC